MKSRMRRWLVFSWRRGSELGEALGIVSAANTKDAKAAARLGWRGAPALVRSDSTLGQNLRADYPGVFGE